LGIGVTVLNDRFGALETTKGGFGLSYTIKTENNQVGFGMSAEYIRHGINGVGNADPNDPIINRALSGAEYFDASFGIHGIYLEKLTYGIMIPSAVSARISDIDEEAESRPVGFILMAGYEVDLHTDITMTPMFLMKNLAYVPTHIDLNLNFGFLQDKLIAGINYTLGADKRLGFLIGTNIEKFNLLYSYNTSSSLIQDYNNGSHEVTLGVNF
jgi:type IX secretion system PorP/SprF family membrane protein